jgi:hypothetical protein
VNRFIAAFADAAARTWCFPEPIVEIGSRSVQNEAEVGAVRTLFGEHYHGLDLNAGAGVDVRARVEQLPFANQGIGSVLALNVFEHVQRFWLGFAEIERVLQSKGLLLLSCPFYFRIHRFPADYWRFTPEAIRELLQGFPALILGQQGPAKRPLSVFAVASPQASRLAPATHHEFHRLLQQRAAPSLRARTHWRYRLGQLVAGPRPFAPYLQAHEFQTQLWVEGQLIQSFDHRPLLDRANPRDHG